MSSLQSRLNLEKNRENIFPVVVLDCMLPRQTLRVRLSDPKLVRLVKSRWINETPTFGVRGTIISPTSGKEMKLMNGVEVEIIERPQFYEDGNKALLVLKAKRRFKVLSEDDNVDGWVDANIQYLDSEQEEREETFMTNQTSMDRAILIASELTDLIQKWIELARKHEKRDGQIDLLLSDLGEEPPSSQPSEKAFYVGALINPLPEMGVARGVRPAIITADTAERRVKIAYEGIIQSIKHMDGSEPLW